MTAKKDTENTVGSNAVIVESTALFALLESRHETMLQWCEPWPACGPEGNDLDAHIILRATVHDCINLQRRAAKAAGRPTTGDDGNHLLDFMAIHWARVVEANKAFRGPNGWYVAFEDETGTHYQPPDGGRYESKEAALAAEDADEGTWVDYDGTIYDMDTEEVLGRVTEAGDET